VVSRKCAGQNPKTLPQIPRVNWASGRKNITAESPENAEEKQAIGTWYLALSGRTNLFWIGNTVKSLQPNTQLPNTCFSAFSALSAVKA
jgi:hypothetical protein